jgi:uncharacterized protein YggT (Ycf19 family)
MWMLLAFIRAFKFVFLLRMVLSFFPIREQTLAASTRQLARMVTDPVVVPVRRALPPLPGAMAGFGVAELLVLIGISIIEAIIQNAV